MIQVEQGYEYFGETYLTCPQCYKWVWSDLHRTWIEDEKSNHKFAGDSIEKLDAWISEHRNHNGPDPLSPTMRPKGIK